MLSASPTPTGPVRGPDDERSKRPLGLLQKTELFQMLLEGRGGCQEPRGSSCAPLEPIPIRVLSSALERLFLLFFSPPVPPKKPEIYNATNHLVVGQSGASIIGPYNEGDPMELICKVTGGRPAPIVMWLINDEVKRTEVVEEEEGILSASVRVPELTRRHLHAVLECRAYNFNGSIPVSSTVTLDMNFRPVNVTILSGMESLSAGSEYELVCQAWGSRPAAIISWWKGGTLPLKDAVMTTSPDSNVTTSILKYQAEMTDSGKYLTCRAQNQLIPQSAREDGLKLNIFYKPVVTLQMGSNLNPDNIKEADDVYFECHINANPVVHRVTWFHNGSPVEHRVTKGIILQNQTLVLQKITREAAGLYTCAAVNLEGEGESQPVNLRVMYKPYCRRHSKTIYGTALHEPASVTCEVEASPGPVTFRWTFNNTSEHLPIPASAVTSQDFLSVASYAPKSHLDYGTLLCWAFNEIGEQSVPCGFAIIAAGPPDPPKNCSIANQTTDTIEVECVAAFDGGLPQTFYMEVYDSTTGALHRNLSSGEPLFHLTELRPGLAFLMVTYAANSKGRSDVAKLETFTLKVAEKRTGPPALLEFTPFLGIVIGVVLVIFLVVIVIITVFKFRKPQTKPEESGPSEEYKGDLENKPLNVGVLRARVKEGVSAGEAEDNDPDLIPHRADLMPYPHYEAIDQGAAAHQSHFGGNFEVSPTVRTMPLQHNQTGPGGEVTYVELAMPLENQSGAATYSGAASYSGGGGGGYSGGGAGGYNGGGGSGGEPCIYATIDHRRSLTINPPSQTVASSPASNPGSTYASRDYRRGNGSFHHHASNPNLYATLDHRRGGTTTTTSTTNPSLYATLPHRKDTFVTSISTTNINISPPGFRDIRMSLRTPLVRRPSESAV
nr:nephrin-like [Procambarus clarkii]